MNKKEMRNKIAELLAQGTAKEAVFDQLSGQGVKDSQLAYLIAAHPDTRRCDEHERKVNILITVMFLQAVIAFVLGYGVGVKIGPTAKWVVAGLITCIPLAFAWGFYRHRVGAYNAYILLSIIQLPKSLEGFSTHPVGTGIGLAISLALIAFIWYVRDKLFPDFGFITPKKIKGRYVFAG